MTWLWILIGIVAFVVVLGVGFAAVRRKRTQRLKERFGPEYDRTAHEADSRRRAESELRERERRRERLDIRPLSEQAREHYAQQWQAIQAGFVDRPPVSLGQADELVQRVMRDRGYPVEDFERRAADVSVDHPDVVENYREAHRISQSAGQGTASTEEQRRAMVHYRALFDGLLHDEQHGEPGPRPPTHPPGPAEEGGARDTA